MTKEYNLADLFKQFFYQDQTLIDFHFFIARHDGILVYENSSNDLSVPAGALTCGLWQAAEALGKLFNLNGKEEFRLSFDSPDQGIYVLKFLVNQNEFYLAIFFQHEINPGFLKARARQMILKLENYLNKQNVASNRDKLFDVRKSYLFSEITDREMDALFSSTES